MSDRLKEDGAAAGVAAVATNTDAGVAGTGDSRLPADQREPGVNRKKKKLRSIITPSPLKRLMK
jgi:hypothetical protein